MSTIDTFEEYKKHLSRYDLGELKAEFGAVDQMHLVYFDLKQQILCLENLEKGNPAQYSMEIIYDEEEIFNLRDVLISICQEIEGKEFNRKGSD